MTRKILPYLALAAALVGLLALVTAEVTQAADHTEATNMGMANPHVNIGDYYGWHTADGNVVLVITVDGNKAPAPDQAGTYNADALYGMHIDTDGDQMADTDIWVRFGQDGEGNWGVQAVNVPGTEAAIEGAVETTLSAGDAQVYAGLRDDPFFFDLEGFSMTVATGDLSFQNERDSIMGTNATAIVVSFPVTALGGATSFDTWSTTAAIPE